jgi:hypothetical protein
MILVWRFRSNAANPSGVKLKLLTNSPRARAALPHLCGECQRAGDCGTHHAEQAAAKTQRSAAGCRRTDFGRKPDPPTSPTQRSWPFLCLPKCKHYEPDTSYQECSERDAPRLGHKSGRQESAENHACTDYSNRDERPHDYDTSHFIHRRGHVRRRGALGSMINGLRSESHPACTRPQPGRSIGYGICTDVGIWVGTPPGEEPRAYLEANYFLLESLTNPLGRLFQERVVNRQHRGDTVDRDFDGVVRRLLNHDIAGEHGSNLVLEV